MQVFCSGSSFSESAADASDFALEWLLKALLNGSSRSTLPISRILILTDPLVAPLLSSSPPSSDSVDGLSHPVLLMAPFHSIQ